MCSTNAERVRMIARVWVWCRTNIEFSRMLNLKKNRVIDRGRSAPDGRFGLVLFYEGIQP